MKHYSIRRIVDGKDVGDITIPENHLYMTMKNHPEWVNLGEYGKEDKAVETKTVEEVLAPSEPERKTLKALACPICSKEFNSERGLKIHKGSHK